MHIENSTPTMALIPTAAVDATPSAMTDKADDAGALQLASLREGADETHVQEHIRGIVAATMANLSIDASDGVKNQARDWQRWALGIADGMEMPDTAPMV